MCAGNWVTAIRTNLQGCGALYDFHGEQRRHCWKAFKALQFVAFLGVNYGGEKLHVKLIYVRQVGAVGVGSLPNGLSYCIGRNQRRIAGVKFISEIPVGRL